MTDRNNLIKLIQEAEDEYMVYEMAEQALANGVFKSREEYIADYLIANGVILPPCKVGTKVWLLRKDRVPDDDYRMNFHDEWVICEVNFQLSMIDQIDKTVFLTPREAEKALERSKGNA